MLGFGGLGVAFQRRRKRHGSSRRWAMKSKKPLGTPGIPTAPVPESKLKVDIMEDRCVQTTKPLSIRVLFSAFGSVMQKCKKTINQICSGLLNVVFFWRGYSARVESLHQKVEELQREMALLHSTLKLYREAKTVGGQGELPAGVQHSLAPPPPPPPPPPLPPPQILVTLAPKVASLPPKPSQTSSLKEKQNGLAAVTLRDLQAVRLRKVNLSQKNLVSPERRSPLVTLADLQKVRLRRSNSDLPLKSRSSRTVCRTPTKNPMNLRVQLRKINLLRSPGGTPLCNKENDVMDSSLDPSMTRGLGNQYLSALTKGLSPLKAV